MSPPDSVVGHPPKKRLLGVTAMRAAASYAAAILATQISREGERCLVNSRTLWVVKVFDFDAVVSVDARAPGIAQRIRAIAIVVEHHRQPWRGAVHDLST